MSLTVLSASSVSGTDKPAISATIGACSGIVVVGVGVVPAGALVDAIRAVIGVVIGVSVVVGVGALVDVIELVFGSVVVVGRLGVVTNGIVVGNPVIKVSFTNGIVVGIEYSVGLLIVVVVVSSCGNGLVIGTITAGGSVIGATY